MELHGTKTLGIPQDQQLTYNWQDAPTADFAVIGDPIEHSLSPVIHHAAYQALKLPYRYVKIFVAASEAGDALDHLKSLGYKGVNVTVPHKEVASAYVEELDDFARLVGAVNTVGFFEDGMKGINTDGPGFADTLKDFQVPSGAHALVLGAGGSARSIVATLLDLKCKVSLYNRTRFRAELLVEQIGSPPVRLLNEPDLADVDIIVNATSIGLGSSVIELNWSRAKPGALAYDLVYGSTPFLKEAARHKLRTVDGKPLLVAQGARSFAWWLGVEPPRDVMMKAIL